MDKDEALFEGSAREGPVVTTIGKRRGLFVGIVLLVTASLSAHAAEQGRQSGEKPRDLIAIAASPPMAAVAETVSAAFAARFEAAGPQVTETSAQSAFAGFCREAASLPDMVISNRRMSHAELARCRRADVGDIVEIPVGFETAIFVTRRSGPALNLTLDQIFDLLAAGGSRLTRWDDQGIRGFGEEVRILLPPRTERSFDIVREQVLMAACRSRPGLGDRPKAADRLAACGDVRDDGAVIETEERSIPKNLGAGEIGLVGNSVFQRSAADLQPVLIDGQAPSVLAVVSGDYAAARPVFVYAKTAQMRKGRGGRVRGLRDLADFIAGDDVTGQNGVLNHLGLVMLPAERRITVRMRTMALVPFDR
jgi:phosphate transport system substrate-binding protein